jgi:hypothetical protein
MMLWNAGGDPTLIDGDFAKLPMPQNVWDG